LKLKIGDEEYEYDHQALTTKEATQLKVQAGLNYSDLQFGNVNDPRVLQAIIWLARTRDGEKRLMYDDIDVLVKDVDIIPDEEPEPEPEGPTVATPPIEPGGSPNGTPTLTENSLSEAVTA
jgi:hypothetical protein